MSEKQCITNIINEFYNVISGKANEKRNWTYFKTLFTEDAKLKPIRINEKKELTALQMDINTYILTVGNFLKEHDFYEYGLNYKIETYKNIANVYSEYEAKKSKEHEQIIKRGVNLIHLYNDGSCWKISSMLWQDE
ncbi:hypothetical protein [Abyssisolibacter fermentans]|uniref:hypothetical protein n=1 Tax=Abyssisolibacter fermentans TaxID=1766203 RepID=UPI00083749B5|nr:hypothetical protein [Abyssisolibacter fermentans]